jgi:hypothetical protein
LKRFRQFSRLTEEAKRIGTASLSGAGKRTAFAVSTPDVVAGYPRATNMRVNEVRRSPDAANGCVTIIGETLCDRLIGLRSASSRFRPKLFTCATCEARAMDARE